MRQALKYLPMMNQVDGASQRRWQYLTDVGLWPRRVEFNWQGWLTNFNKDELRFAARLLDSFLYFSSPLTRQLFKSAFLNISQTVCTKTSLVAARDQWALFLKDLIVVRVTGERPSDADSAFAFTRLARDDLEVNEAQILSAKQAIARLRSNGSGNVLFVDDFVGSGSQFIKTWERKEDIGGSRPFTSYSDIAKDHPAATRFFYCTAVASSYGIEKIAKAAPDVKVCPGQLLDARASAIAVDSLIWREDMASEGPEFVRVASLRAGLSDAGGDQDDWRGFHNLGLSLAFSHGWPDANLGFYTSDQNGWVPLLRRGAL